MRRPLLSTFALFTLALGALSTAAKAQATLPTSRPLRSTDIYRLRDVGAGRLSPDGQWIAYTVVTVDSAKDRSDSDVWMVNWEGTRTLKMAGSPESESNPRWSPDNRYLAFVSGRYDSKGGQIWLLDRAGGEAVRLTDLTGGISEYEWSPDGTRIALVSRDPDPDEGKPDSLRARTPKPIVIDRYARVGRERDDEVGGADHQGRLRRPTGALVPRRHAPGIHQRARRR
jgi:dipeptidyl aminopeptidase/acylaminoacyl peptidase